MKIYLAYFVSLIALVVLDLSWTGWLARGFYTARIGHLFRDHVMWLPIIIFYLMYAGAILFFVSIPAHGSVSKALIYGALFGIAVYGTYDLTNQGLLSNWPWSLTLVDIGWGAFLSAVISVVGVSLL